MKDFILTNFI